MFHDPELSVWNVMGSSPNKVSPCTSLSSLSNLTSTTGMLTVCLLVMMMHEKSSNAFMGACLLMDRAHEYDRLDEAFLAGLRLILTATYLKKTQPKSARRYLYPAKVPSSRLEIGLSPDKSAKAERQLRRRS